MGFYASADLIWGIPVKSYTGKYDKETGEDIPTPFWSEEDDDWVEMPGVLEIRTFGHYENYEEAGAILTHKDVQRYSGDSWEPAVIENLDQPDESYVDQANLDAQAAGLDVDFNEAKWYLVASYG